MANFTVYVRPEMVKEIRKRPEVNWSALAQEAFQRELDKPHRDYLHVSTPLRGKIKRTASGLPVYHPNDCECAECWQMMERT